MKKGPFSGKNYHCCMANNKFSIHIKKKREAPLLSRLSPIIKYCPCGIIIGRNVSRDGLDGENITSWFFPARFSLRKIIGFVWVLIQENEKLVDRSVFSWFYHDILLISFMYIVRFSNNAGMAFQQEG